MKKWKSGEVVSDEMRSVQVKKWRNEEMKNEEMKNEEHEEIKELKLKSSEYSQYFYLKKWTYLAPKEFNFLVLWNMGLTVERWTRDAEPRLFRIDKEVCFDLSSLKYGADWNRQEGLLVSKHVGAWEVTPLKITFNL